MHAFKKMHIVKTIYDCSSCAVSIILSFVFFGFGHFEGVKLGTLIGALVNGWLIGRISRGMERHFDFKDALKINRTELLEAEAERKNNAGIK